MSKDIKNVNHNDIQDMPIQIEADENKEIENVDCKNSYESSDDEQLKEDSHEYK